MNDIWYDNEEDVLGIQLADKKYWKSIELSENALADISRGGEIVGIEILKASDSFKKDAPLVVSKARPRLKKQDLPAE